MSTFAKNDEVTTVSKPVMLTGNGNDGVQAAEDEIPTRNLWASTALTVLLGWSVHRPNILLFIIGWPGSELVHIWMALQTCNLFWLTKSYPKLFARKLGKFALILNAYALSLGASSLWEALGAREAFAKALLEAGITPRAGESTPGRITSMLAMIPLFYVSRRGKSLQIQRNIPYASINDIDPALVNRWKQMPPFVRNIAMVARGRISQWMSLDIISLSGVVLKDAPVLFAIHGGAWSMADKLYSAHALLNRIASRGVVVCVVNYRMSPERAWPVHIVDCKRALIFVKRNCHLWGGSPDKVFATGESAGGHLSALVALTVNFPEFQPPEDPLADVTVRGALPLYGVHDWTNSSGHSHDMPLFASRQVLRKPLSSRQTWLDLEKASPVFHVREMTAQAANPNLCSFFIPHGTRDVLASYKDATVFYEALRDLRGKFPLPFGDQDVFVTLDGAHHAFGYFPSLRSNALGDAMSDFIFHHSRVRAD